MHDAHAIANELVKINTGVLALNKAFGAYRHHLAALNFMGVVPLDDPLLTNVTIGGLNPCVLDGVDQWLKNRVHNFDPATFVHPSHDYCTQVVGWSVQQDSQDAAPSTEPFTFTAPSTEPALDTELPTPLNFDPFVAPLPTTKEACDSQTLAAYEAMGHMTPRPISPPPPTVLAPPTPQPAMPTDFVSPPTVPNSPPSTVASEGEESEDDELVCHLLHFASARQDDMQVSRGDTAASSERTEDEPMPSPVPPMQPAQNAQEFLGIHAAFQCLVILDPKYNRHYKAEIIHDDIQQQKIRVHYRYLDSCFDEDLSYVDPRIARDPSDPGGVRALVTNKKVGKCFDAITNEADRRYCQHGN